MAYFKKVKIKNPSTGETRYYPRAVQLGEPVTTEQLAKRIARESTVSAVDVRAVLESLSGIMGEYMADGRKVKLDGIGSFYYTCSAAGNGSQSADECSASDINGIRVRFLPQYGFTYGANGRVITRALAEQNVKWYNIDTVLNASQASSGSYSSGDDMPVVEQP